MPGLVTGLGVGSFPGAGPGILAPMGRRLPACGFTFDGQACEATGAHLCEPRAAHAEAFFAELLVHTKGTFARQAFRLAAWERDEVVRPLLGTVEWSEHWGRYVRTYTELYLSTAKKNGKSELVAGLCLYLLAADDEEGPEVYGLALDKDQAALVWSAAKRMCELSPVLAERLEVYISTTRIVDPQRAGFFTTLAGDAFGALGPNPHGWYIDELLTQPDRSLYDALHGGMGTRTQPLGMLVTTADNNPAGYAASEREWSEAVLADPGLDRRRLVVLHTAPPDLPWDSDAAIMAANPGIAAGYLDPGVIRDERDKAVNNPAAQRAYEQFRLNRQQRKAGKAIVMDAWDRGAGPLPDLAGQRCWAGLDLASTSDLASYALDFRDGPAHRVLWRIFAPQAAMPALDRRTGNRASVWASQGWITVTEGDVIDYGTIREALREDAEVFDIAEVAYDRWGATQLASELIEEGVPLVQVGQGFATMSGPTKEILRLIAAGDYRHGGNPAVRWQAENMVTKSDAAGNLKPDKATSPEKIDSMVAAVMALGRALAHQPREDDYAAAGF